MVNHKKFSEFTTATLSDSSNEVVGLGSGVNVKAAKVTTWTTLTRPTPPFNGLLGYNTTLDQYEYWNALLAAWVQIPNGSIVNATYILQTPNALLPSAQSLSALSTGILKSTTATGVLSISASLTSIDSLTSAADQLLYSTGVNSYALTGLSAFARTLLDDTSATTMRSTLGLGTAAVKNATDNAQTTVVSANGAFTVGHLLVAADTAGTAIDGGVPFGGGTVTSITAGTGLTATPNPIVVAGTISFASIAANSLWVNNTAGIAVPTVSSLAALTKTDDTNVTLTLGGTPATALINSVSLTLGWTGTLSSTKGGLGLSDPTAHGILVGEGASAVTPIVLSSGQILIGSTGVDPVAAAINSGTGILVANGAGSITVNLAAIADHTVLANISGGALAPSSTTLTALIDNAIGSVQGDILYRNATVWTVLAPGTSGQLLKTGGAAANPSWTTATFPATGGAAGNILISNGTNYIASTSLWPNTVGATGKIVRSDGTTNTYSTATYPDTAGTSGNILTSDGTNWLSSPSAGVGSPLTTKGDLYTFSTLNARLAVGSTNGQILQVSSGAATGLAWSTPTYPSTSGTSGKIVISDGTNNVYSTPTYPNASVTAGKFIISDGTNYIASTSIMPNTVGAAGKIIRSDGTVNAYSTSTFADTYTASNILYSNGANTVTGLATANSGVLTTDSSGVPSITLLANLAINASLVKTVKTQVFTSSGTYTPSTGMLYCIIELVGGGGGGGGAAVTVAGQAAAGGGGSSGGYAKGVFSAASVGASQVVTIGAGGAGGAAGANNGVAGGTTSVGALINATGGGIGNGCASGTSTQTAAGAGGSGSGPGLNLPGETGGYAITSGTFWVPSHGAASFFGTQTPTTFGTEAGLAAASYGYGGGGSGGVSSNGSAAKAGGAGSDGIVFITEFCNQ